MTGIDATSLGGMSMDLKMIRWEHLKLYHITSYAKPYTHYPNAVQLRSKSLGRAKMSGCLGERREKNKAYSQPKQKRANLNYKQKQQFIKELKLTIVN